MQRTEKSATQRTEKLQVANGANAIVIVSPAHTDMGKTHKDVQTPNKKGHNLLFLNSAGKRRLRLDERLLAIQSQAHLSDIIRAMLALLHENRRTLPLNTSILHFLLSMGAHRPGYLPRVHIPRLALLHVRDIGGALGSAIAHVDLLF